MLISVRNRLVAWLIERHPRIYLRWKKLGKHRLGADPGFLRAHAHLVREFASLQRFEERYNLWALARSVSDRAGAFAEVGVYRGGSAFLLCAAKDDTPLHLFDTFGGMPAVNPASDGAFRAGDFSDCSLDQVRAFLAGHSNLHFHAGIFPASAALLTDADLKFKFAHLDVDLHASTIDALNWFYPRMVRGGLIVTHDYNDVTVPGVKRAFDDFFSDKPEVVVPLWFSQAVVTKL